MADEPQYSSGTDTGSNKRKYEEQTTPPSRRPTGFSAPISSTSPDSAPPSYNSVPPPVDEIQLAKQRAQEIAARLFNNASAGAGVAPPLDAKRPRVENGGGFDSSDKGFSSAPTDSKPHNPISAPSSIPVSYGFQGSSKKIEIPNGRVGVIIGKGGETIKYLQLQSGAKIQVTRDMDADLNSPTRMVELMGTPEQIAKAEQLITDVLAGAESGSQGMQTRRVGGQSGSEQFVMKIPNNKVGLVIGKGGETIKNMQARTGARIQVIPLHLPPGDASIERTLQIDGTSEQIETAKQLVNEVISENRVRNPGMSGGYPQQGYQARPPTSWGPPGAPPTQQPGYGYGQPGSYSGPSSQYNMPQHSYPGYPPQPTSGGYPSSWDQSTVPPSQQTSHGGGYDYYSQQAPTHQQQNPGAAAPADNTGYNYGQTGASGYQQGQGYSQDGYGGYNAPQSGYGQPPQYDQQQGYSAAGYGNVSNPTDGHTSSYGSQGDSTQAPPSVPPTSAGQQGYNTSQPSPNPSSYPPQGANQPGYGVPPNSQAGYGSQPAAQPGYGHGYGAQQGQKPPPNPPVYGQAAQSPSTPGGYSQQAPQQPGYPHSQPPPAGYAQPDSGSQRGPSSYGAATSQPGYGAAPYGAPPAGQPGYGQGPPYNSSYGSGYSQPPVYTADGNSGGSGRSAYDGPPASQSSQQSGVAKTSPQS
ncbi:Far upstream element-binding protein 2 [Morus notabilis]|uniref:Far upstream element-binding protein 2 n=1 Tax=Morus notabilis TaxID=981085 RepID=W9R3G4_9ROSA|nr:far upstream element-binding protein 2 [Morus notabilis]EXB66885.1 Far upstream element-binding protein 2 [Morus notabilis]